MKGKVLGAILLVLTLCGCGTSQDQDYREIPRFQGVDPQLEPYVREYLTLSHGKLGEKNTRKLTMGFGDRPGDVVGTCWGLDDNRREVEIDREFWGYAPDPMKRSLVFHELTHCLCNRGHTYSTGTYPDSEQYYLPDQGYTPEQAGYFPDDLCPTSIMFPIVMDTHCLSRHQEHYDQEMFLQCRP